MELNLEKGKEYVLTHKRKGIFRAKLLDVVAASPGDRQDRKLLTFEIPTGTGSGQERLARVDGAELTVTNIRPSLVTNMAVSTRSPKLPGLEVKEVEPVEESVLDRLQRGWKRLTGGKHG